MKIVWIEDDADTISPVVRPLKDASHEIEVIRTVREALEKVELIRGCDLILLDIIMPIGTGPAGAEERWGGLTLLRQLREEHHIDKPVVVFSVVSNEHVLEQLRDLGVADIVRKPVLPSQLKQRVEAAWADWQHRREENG